MKSFRLRGPQKPLMLALLPFDPGRVLDVGEPTVDRRAQLGLSPQPRGKGDVADTEIEAAPQLGERAELVQLAQPVEPVAGGCPRRDDEPGLLEIADHAGGPAGVPGRVSNVERIHRQTLTHLCQGLPQLIRPASVAMRKAPSTAIAASTVRAASPRGRPSYTVLDRM